MENESDWVADVRRWCLAGAQVKLAASAQVADTESAALGYEAAHPALQSRHWPVAPPDELTDLK